MKKVVSYLSAAFTVIGGVVGAGFITGKEISTFFPFPNISVTYITLILFFLFFYISLTFGAKSKTANVVSAASSCCSVIISASMISALENVFQILCQTENVKILLIISLVIAIIVSSNGVNSIGKFNLAFMPLALGITIYFALSKTSLNFAEPIKYGKIEMPVLYVGMNTFTSFKVLADIGDGKSPKFNAVTAIFSSFVLAVLIFVISLAISTCKLQSSVMPLISMLDENSVSRLVMLIICLLGIFSTLICSLYSSFSLFGDKRKTLKNLLLSLAILWISRFGFSNLVEKIYPIIGILGTIAVVSVVLAGRALKSRRKHTLSRQEYKVLRCLP